jgi:transglutaminase-like putative cysteine protease
MLLLAGDLAAQKIAPEDAALADQLKKRYPDSKEASLSSEDEYTFELNSSKTAEAPVSATEKSSHSLMALRDGHTYVGSVFYDSQSDIEKVRVSSKAGKMVSVLTYDKQYESDGIFYNDAMIKAFSIGFTKKGEEQDYEYIKNYHDVKYLVSAYFHEGFPIEERTITFQVPDWLSIDLKEMNFDGYNIQKTVTPDPKAKKTTYTYKAKNLAPLKNERNAPNAARSYPHILIICKSYSNNQKTEKLFDSVDALYSWYSGLCKDINENNDELKPMVTQLTANKKTDIEKIEAIYYWVQENVRYIAFENGIMGFRPEAANKVYNNKYGDCKGKANLLKQMLRLAGYDARLTWIGTADLPYDYSTPSLAVDNHMICTLILNGKRYFLDGTEDYISLNDNAERIQGKEVLIEDGEKFIIDKIPVVGAERNKVETIITLALNSDVITGKLKSTYNGEQKTNILRGYASIRADKKDDAMKAYLTGSNKNLKLSNIVTSDLGNRQAPLQISYDLELSNQVTNVGNEMYVSMDMDKELSGYEFDSTRVNDYEFQHKMTIDTRTELAIPQGYKVDYLPEAVSKKYDGYSFDLNYKTEGEKIIYTKKIVISNAIISKKDFKNWNATVKAARKFYNDQVIFVKQ